MAFALDPYLPEHIFPRADPRDLPPLHLRPPRCIACQPISPDRDRHALGHSRCAAAIAGVKAIRAAEPETRMVHIAPLILVVAPRDRPDLAHDAERETREDTFYAWDVIAGLRQRELGGGPEVLDTVGVSCSSLGQMEFRERGPHAALEPHDERIRPLGDLLAFAWERYRRPMIVGETRGLGAGRPAWLRAITEESLAAVSRGVDLRGVCLLPPVDMPHWHTGEGLRNGICDLVEENGDLKRVPFEPYIAELRRWQKRPNRATELDDDLFIDPVNLGDIVAAAHRTRMHPDKNCMTRLRAPPSEVTSIVGRASPPFVRRRRRPAGRRVTDFLAIPPRPYVSLQPNQNATRPDSG